MQNLKHSIFTNERVESLSLALHKEHKQFDRKEFLKSILDKEWKNLELKQRVRKVSTQMGIYLPSDYENAIHILKKVAPNFDGFFGVIFPDYVELYGQNISYEEISLDALKDFTKFSTSEFAIRPFIKRDPERMLKTLNKWAESKNEHIRRLCSEGPRPRLPWGTHLPEFIQDPTPLFPLLEKLIHDDSEYVRKSVGNNLNDISKDHPKLVLKQTKKWYGKDEQTNKLLKKGLRTLLKQGNEDALKIFGLNSKNFKIYKISHDEKVKIGNRFNFSFKLSIYQNANYRIEYALYFLRKDETHHKKVFKHSEKNWKEGKLEIFKSHNFKKISTRTYYPGTHYLSIIINGVESKKRKFELTK